PEPPVTCKVGVYGINNFGEDSNSYVYHFDVTNGTYAYVDGVANTASNIAAHDGELYFMEQNDSATKASSLWKVSLDNAEQTLAANAVSWPIYRSAVTPDGTKLLATSKTYLYEFDMQTGEKTVFGKLSYAGDEFSHGDIAYSADTNVIYVLTGKALYTLDKGAMTLDLVGEHGVNWASGLAVSSDGTLYVSGRNKGEDAKIYTLDPNTAESTFVMDGPEHINDLTYVANYCE
ncbi:hemolysin-type calcium-binding protein, partial [Pseudoalteromonas sp. A757]